MFEGAEIGEKLDRTTYEEREPLVREALLDAQFRLREAPFSVVIVIAGAEGAGKGETVNCLLDWLDARGVETHAMGAPSDEELARPRYFQFWRRLPPRGKIGIFFGSWYTKPVVDRIEGRLGTADFEREMRRIVEFERMLVNEGTLLVKVWLHITKKQQRKRLRELEKNPETSWRVTPRDWEYCKTYDEFLEAAGVCLRLTSSGHAPWQVIEATDHRYRHITVAERVRDAVARQLDATSAQHNVATPVAAREPLPTPRERNLLNSLPLDRPMDEREYEEALAKEQSRVGRLARELSRAGIAAALVFEGMDGAGKGGCIRRIIHALDARFYRVHRISAPTDEERARPYLWRFWRTVPRTGRIAIYDRSWYGRVLVERIEGFCGRDDWLRGYAEINAFEQELAEDHILVLKFWLAISDDEQLARFRSREATGYKRYKLTDEDWRNRDKAPAYEAAACDMIERTSTDYAPWMVVEADNKWYARVKVLRAIADSLERALDTRRHAAESKSRKRRKSSD